MNTFTTAKIVLLLGAIALTLGIFLPAGQLDASEARGTIAVGAFDQEKAFESYPGREELVKVYTAAQQSMQEAQQKGNQETLEQIQLELQRKQQQIVGQFHDDIGKALPGVAEQLGLKVIALNIVYAAEGIETRDVTLDVIEAIGGEPQTPDVR